MNFPSMHRPPSLSDDEWLAVESLLGHPVTDRVAGAHAFWEDTYANEHALLDNFNRLAWLGDRVLNLALADRRESEAPAMRRWNGTGNQGVEQSCQAAVAVWARWPEQVRLMMRLGNAKGGWANDKIVGTYVEAVVGLLFREHGYEAARAFVWRHWPYAE